MGREHRTERTLSRRTFIGAAAAAGVAGAWPASQALGRGLPDPLPRLRIPAENRGIILFSIRDAVSQRNPTTSDLPSGFKEVFEYIAQIGYKQVEFAGYTQNAAAEGGAGANAWLSPTNIPTPAVNPAFLPWANTLRGWLDQYGLKANGTHAYIPNNINPAVTTTPLASAQLDRFKRECEFAATLGMELYGTGNDVSGSRFKEDWKVATERWNTLGAVAKTYGLKLYTHNHDGVWNFILDRKPLDANGRPTRSSGVRMQDYGAHLLDADLVFYEIDIYWAHVAQHRFRSYTDADGVVQESILDPAGWVAKHRHRVPAFHAKDGTRTADPPGTGSGYVFVPFGASGGDGVPPEAESGIDFTTFYDRIGRADHVSFWEQDNAPGNATTNPGQSLTFAAQSYTAMVALGAVGS